ncbi:glycoside hydrolase family 1 protein [Culicoidibacter larvae]|uniref:Glycoside hydrolase family 1 protein n=1 Tax=Culicoidibacter larvae TaxID=2579976 RepID=A0A5R8QBH1_9FIRM|nr:glycoside hydrolase family 1 protein [Culicoidibacter larvae]TLG72941.1 glycoside hydrolase family 1 protein [Culicoidibacter larvae]
MAKIEFSADFDWGTASSGPQSEGSADKPHESLWEYWYAKDPERFYQQVGPKITCDSYHRYKEDVAIMKELGLKSFRTSIQWSRLIKDLETGEPDEKAVAFYNDYINEMIAAGVEPVMNLFHFDTPIALEHEYGGFKNKHVAELFVKFATTAFTLFGDRVKRWITFNEPVAHAKGAYLYDFIYPNEVNTRSYTQANYNILLAHAGSVEAYHKLNLDGEIGIVVDLLPPIPRSQNSGDLLAAEVFDLFTNRIFMDPCVKGEYADQYLELLEKHNCNFEYTSEELELIKNNTVDFIGINYYQPQRVKAPARLPNINDVFMPDWYFDNYEMPNRRMNVHRGWEIYPKTIYDIAMRVKNEYGNIKWYVSENGMGVHDEDRFKDETGMICDDYRIEFIQEHLQWLNKAIQEGSNCQGYHLWTFVDNWSWTNAYKNRYGYVSLDLKTRNRTIKKSGYWIKEVIANNGFEELKPEFE